MTRIELYQYKIKKEGVSCTLFTPNIEFARLRASQNKTYYTKVGVSDDK